MDTSWHTGKQGRLGAPSFSRYAGGPASETQSERRIIPTAGPRAVIVLAEAVLLAILWLALTRADPRAFVFGAVVIAAALALRVATARTPRLPIRLPGLARFVPFFIWHSLLGGLDVALRALRPSLPVEPDGIRHRLALPPGAERAFFMGVVSLLPGTLSADLDGDILDVHVIGGVDGVEDRLARLEAAVADAFGASPQSDADREVGGERAEEESGG